MGHHGSVTDTTPTTLSAIVSDMITTALRRIAGLLIALVGASTVPFMTPAWACGCGAYSPDEGGHASVPTETALVRRPEPARRRSRSRTASCAPAPTRRRCTAGSTRC
jgi:hypothetical protein